MGQNNRKNLSALEGHVRDFLVAVDRGYFGDAFLVDGQESEFIVPLREAVNLPARRSRESFGKLVAVASPIESDESYEASEALLRHGWPCAPEGDIL